MCDDSSNNRNVTYFKGCCNVKRISLLKLLLIGLLGQYVAVTIVNCAVVTAEVATDAETTPDYNSATKDATAAADSRSSSSLTLQQRLRYPTEDDPDSTQPAFGGVTNDVVGALPVADEYGDDEDADEDDVDVEFAGYVNDFNLQHEASIPEDIFDQRRLEDEPKSDKDEDAVEDIILESQRSTSSKFTFSDDIKNYSLSSQNNSNNDNYKRKKKKTSNQLSKYKSYNNEGGDDNSNNNDNDFFSESIATEDYIQHGKQQHLNNIENLNERKFNKVSVAEKLNNDDDDDGDMTWSDDNININSNLNEKHQNINAIADKLLHKAAIGDIRAADEDERSFTGKDEVGPSEAMATDSDESLAAIGGQIVSKIPATTTTSTASTPATATSMGRKYVSRKTKRHGRSQQMHAAERVQRTAADMETTFEPRARHHRKDKNNNNNTNEHARLSEPQLLSQPDYAVSYFGSTANDSSPNPTTNEQSAGSSHVQAADGLRKVIEDATLSKPFENAFEMHKAMRRNNRRSGHKTHKKKYKDYLRYNFTPTAKTTASPEASTVMETTENVKVLKAKENNPQLTDRRRQRIAKLAAFQKDIKAAFAPIFAVSQRNSAGAARPYYEGQLSYYVETEDDDVTGAHTGTVATDGDTAEGGDVGKLITSETGTHNNNWFGRISPILRNGKPRAAPNNEEHRKHHHQKHQHHHQHQHHHRQHDKQQPQRHAYQRRLSNRRIPASSFAQRQSFLRYPPHVDAASQNPTYSLPSEPSYHRADSQKGALQELGHQITQMEELDRYYSKWPHLARVQYQLNDEDYRETHVERMHTKPNADYDYHLLDDIDEEEENDDEDDNLPPYIKKYNRRNKQLLNLLEGTLPPSTTPARPQAYRRRKYSWSGSVLQPGPVETSAMRIDDDYLKEKRRRYYIRNHDNNDKEKFARHEEEHTKNLAAGNAAKDIQDVNGESPTQPQLQQQQNHIPDEDVDVSSQEFDDWEREMESRMTGSDKMKWQIESAAKTTATPTDALLTSTRVTAAKSLLQRRPSYSGFAGSYVTSKQRSPTAQFVPNSSSNRVRSVNNGNGFVNVLQAGSTGNYKSTPRFRAGNKIGFAAEGRRAVSNDNTNDNSNYGTYSLRTTSNSSFSAETATPTTFLSAVVAKPIINSFVYHRVEVAPRLVGAGSTGGRKQRLPFVAITDRRLETSKKPSSLDVQQRDFEQNHYPMP